VERQLRPLSYLNPYTLHINLYDPVILGVIFTGLIFALQLWFTKKINQAANQFLSLALVAMVLWMTRILGIDIGLSAYLTNWSRLPLQFSLGFGPLLYFYVLKITQPEYKFRFKDLLHFSPLLLELGAHAFEVGDSIKTGKATDETQTFHYVNPILQLLAFISVIIYLYYSFKLIERFYRRLKFNDASDRYRYELRWLHNLLIAFSALWVLWIPFTAVDYFYYHYQSGIHAYYPLYLLLAVMTIWMAAVTFFRREAGILMEFKPPQPAELKQKGIWLKKVVKANLYYQDPELSLVLLAEKLNLTTHELSRIINTALKKSFNDFINEYRVAEVIKRMQDPAYDGITLLGIAYDSGFNSKSTFNLIFKKMTGKTPVEYKTNLGKEFLSYNLGHQHRFAAVISNHDTTSKWSLEKLNRNYMIKNYFKTALRNLSKQKTLSFINISGLSVGIACFNLFMLYAINEFSFDGFHKNANNTYLVLDENAKQNIKALQGVIYTPMPLGPAMKQELPGVENYVRYIQPFETFIKIKNEVRRENIAYADSSFFHVFSFKFKYGNAKSAISGLHSMVLTEESAERLFGKTNAIGESFQVKIGDAFETFIVTAIAENPPSNSSFQYSMLINFDCIANSMLGKIWAHDWWMNSFVTLVQLKPGSTLANDSKSLANFWHRHFPGAGSGGYDLVPIKDVHTSPALVGVAIPPVDPKSIWMLLSIAAGVLLIACINFTTLSIGRSAGRAKEVGIRKVIGGTRKALVVQFLTESLLLAFFSTLIGLALVYLLLPYFNQLSGRELSFSFVQFPQLTGLIAGLVLIVGLLSGCYPALVLSGFNTVDVLKAKIKLGGANFFTKALVTFQFVLSAALIISAIVIMQQLHYMESRNPGFDKENVLVVQTYGVSDTKHLFPLFKQELSRHPGISGLASADNGLGEHEGTGFTDFSYREKSINTNQFHIDPDYIPTLGLHLLAGRNFDRTIASDTVNAVIINESMMNQLGWQPENCTGRQLDGYGDHGFKNPTVIGVVRDFNYEALTDRVRPALFHQFARGGESRNIFYVRLQPGDPSKALAAIHSAWKKIAPDYPLKYNFLDEDINRFYKAETRLSNIIGWAGGIAIFLGCLGLLGLSALAVVNRTKEIGIRKVLGASVSTIISLISKDFLRLVTMAFVIATPITWWLMHKWLQGYAYRINIEWWVFGVCCAAIITVSLLTVCFQAIKAAIANPVKSLRSE
jgi:putative ABC transport system permease protein